MLRHSQKTYPAHCTNSVKLPVDRSLLCFCLINRKTFRLALIHNYVVPITFCKHNCNNLLLFDIMGRYSFQTKLFPIKFIYRVYNEIMDESLVLVLIYLKCIMGPDKPNVATWQNTSGFLYIDCFMVISTTRRARKHDFGEIWSMTEAYDSHHRSTCKTSLTWRQYVILAPQWPSLHTHR